MPTATKDKLTEKQSLFSTAMFTIGSLEFGNGIASARKAGYSGTNNTLGQRAHELVNNSKVIAEKERIQADIKDKTAVDRDYLIEQTKDILISSNDNRLKIKALSLLGDFIGAKRETAPNNEREAAKLKLMSSEQRRLAEQLALILTNGVGAKAIDSMVVDMPSVHPKAITGDDDDMAGVGA